MTEKTKRSSPYAVAINPCLKKFGREDIDPRHIEAYMRLQYGTLSHLSRETFEGETKLLIEVVDLDLEGAEETAQSYGL